MTNVTAIIPAFNSASTIHCAIESVLRQQDTFTGALAIVVVDDGSTDELAGALRLYGDRIRIIRHATNQGPAAARNTGIAAVDSGYIAFLDSDDTWLTPKLARQIEIMQRYRWRACCTAYYLRYDDGSEVVSPTYDTRELSLSDAIWGCFTGPGSTLICKREIFEDVGYLDQRLGRLEDWEWQLRLMQRHKLGFIGDPLARVRKSYNQQVDKVYEALDVIRSAYRSCLPANLRRRFDAAIDIERAAANYRAGKRIAAALNLTRSIMRCPLGNASLSAVLHNRGHGRIRNRRPEAGLRY